MTSALADASTIQIWRYDDPVLGPRQIPEFQNYKKGKTLLADGALVLDTEKQNIKLVGENGTSIDLGRHFIYVVE